MLQFIVLGLIPGTNFQITFASYLVFLLGLALLVLVSLELSHFFQRQSIKDKDESANDVMAIS